MRHPEEAAAEDRHRRHLRRLRVRRGGAPRVEDQGRQFEAPQRRPSEVKALVSFQAGKPSCYLDGRINLTYSIFI